MTHLPYPPDSIVMWRMQRADGLASHLVVSSSTTGALAAWYLNGRPQGARAFDNVRGAVQFGERMQHQNWAVGWRLVGEDEDTPR